MTRSPFLLSELGTKHSTGWKMSSSNTPGWATTEVGADGVTPTPGLNLMEVHQPSNRRQYFFVTFCKYMEGKQAQAFPKAVIAMPQGDQFSNDLVRHC